jgi:hypothetical protein
MERAEDCLQEVPPPRKLARINFNDAVPPRYASLYFCACIDNSDNELITLEAIHHYVEVQTGSCSVRACEQSY